MAYCTQADLQAAVGGLEALTWISDLTNVQVDVAAVASAIEYASAVIDSYATGTPETGSTPGDLWAPPGPGTPTQAKQAAITLAIYRLYETIRREVPAQWQVAFDRTIANLADLAAGKVSWVGGQPPAVQVVSSVFQWQSRQPLPSGSLRRATRYQTDGL